MTKEDVLRYLHGQALVNQITIEEERQTPLEERLEQLAILHHAGNEMGWFRGSEEEEDDAVRDLWVRLKEKLGGNLFNEEEPLQSIIHG